MHIPDRRGVVAAKHHLALTAQEKSCVTLLDVVRNLEWSFGRDGEPKTKPIMNSVQQSAVILYRRFSCSLFFRKSSDDLLVALNARRRLPVVVSSGSSSEDDESTSSHSGAATSPPLGSLFSLPLSTMSPRTSQPPAASPQPASSPLASPVLGGSPLRAKGQVLGTTKLPTPHSNETSISIGILAIMDRQCPRQSGAHRVVDDSRHTYLRMQ
ncbi:uncharacterized protein NFIA_087980 [Aspergillus fischeri NRRL 181]|uniref:Uncharacterized protein n=1 Tax=Neosartorya fischeri (strain ATCC 1020 / DSM 3700 / CBS 544.65 / FGSC A1164 / JCM 1740 / NRRL 181 / WB 181) TaxID=331117 RepID=A1DHI5_NEOFI|nr:uncharacterized protein NFIA_087980 [Aspergillus fischeri NRRL 181]EAW18842.1 hypothetical protein NFIA_087980 [Aspergillus fischeri NRRL 181]KAG2012347.1 hypothetical protein GB937_007175 [Aspergillus fischeri]